MQNLQNSPPDSDIFLHADDDDIRQWTAHIRGPQDTPFAGGENHCRLNLCTALLVYDTLCSKCMDFFVFWRYIVCPAKAFLQNFLCSSECRHRLAKTYVDAFLRVPASIVSSRNDSNLSDETDTFSTFSSRELGFRVERPLLHGFSWWPAT